MPQKPVDLWFGIAGLVAGILLFVVPRTPLTIVLLLTLAFLLLIHPAWNFWWIEKALWRRVSALIILAIILAGVGYGSWPTPPIAVVATTPPASAPATSAPSSGGIQKPPEPSKHSPEPSKVPTDKKRPKIVQSEKRQIEEPATAPEKKEIPSPSPNPQIVNNAPGGIAISGGNVTNPTVNNFAPPDPKFTVSVVEIPLSPEDTAKYKMRVIIKTDREADIPPILAVFDGPYLKAHMSVHGRGSGGGSNVMFFNGKRDGVEYPWAQFALGAAGELRPDGEIHIDVEADKPIKLREIGRP
jgi:hypothetical protein